MFNIDLMFAEFIFECKLENNNGDVLSDCYKVQQYSPSQCRSNSGGYHSDDIAMEDLQTNGCYHLINLITNIHTATKQLPEPYNALPMTNLWLNINKQNDYNYPHEHPNSGLSGIYYVTDTNEDNGELFMIREPSSRLMIAQNGMASDYTPSLRGIYRRSFSAGSLVFFPSHITHSVGTNHTNTPRVSLSFNMGTPSN